MGFSQRLLSGAVEKTYGPLPFVSDSNPCHMENWLECLRSRRDPNASVDAGFSHSVVSIMSPGRNARAGNSTGTAKVNRSSPTRLRHRRKRKAESVHTSGGISRDPGASKSTCESSEYPGISGLFPRIRRSCKPSPFSRRKG